MTYQGMPVRLVPCARRRRTFVEGLVWGGLLGAALATAALGLVLR